MKFLTMNSQDIAQTLPHNLDAEQALLSTLMHHNGSYEKISEFLKPDHFSHVAHQKIFQAMGRLIERGQIADPVTLKDFFQKHEDLAQAGGTDYLAYLATNVLSFANVLDYGRLIYDLALRRSLIEVSQELVEKAQGISLDNTAEDHIEWAEQQLFDLATTGEANSGFMEFGDALAMAITQAEKAFKRDSQVVGITTGLKDLDKWLGGLHGSDLIILAGRPSMGKTALATNIAFNAAKATQAENGGITAFFSLEMSAEQLAARLLAQESRVASDRIRRGDVSQADFMKFTDISREMATIPLYIDDTPALTVSAIRTRVRRLKRKYGLGLIVIDYLQLLQGSNNKHDNRVNEVSQITRSLKALAKEMQVPVLALSQLSRTVESREDKRPQLSDLRESGSIEQDADVVMFVYREEYYVKRQEVPAGHKNHEEWKKKMSECYEQAEIILAKQRHGPVGTVRLHYDAPHTKFADYYHPPIQS